MKTEHLKNQHISFPWAYLFFKTLLYNKDYGNYCDNLETQKDPRLTSLLEDKYEYIKTIYDFWGNVSTFEDVFSDDNLPRNRFRLWFALYGHKLLGLDFDKYFLVPSGSTITPKIGEVYFTVDEEWDIEEYVDLYSPALHEAAKTVQKECSKFPPNKLLGLRMKYPTWLPATEQRLDAFKWKIKDRLSQIACLENAVNSKKNCWIKIQSGFQTVADTARLVAETNKNQIRGVPGKELSGLKSEVAKFARQGQKLIDKILLGEFPHYK